MEQKNKYVLNYMKLMESKSNIIDVLNFTDNIILSKMEISNFSKSKINDLESKTERLKTKVEGLHTELIKLLQLAEVIEKS